MPETSVPFQKKVYFNFPQILRLLAGRQREQGLWCIRLTVDRYDLPVRIPRSYRREREAGTARLMFRSSGFKLGLDHMQT